MIKKNKIIYLILTITFTLIFISACSGNTNKTTAVSETESSTPETESSVETSEETVTTSIKETSEAEEENKVTKYNFTDILNQVAQKGNDWSSLPLSDNFRNTYNSEEGIIARNNLKKLVPLNRTGSNYEEKYMKFDLTYTYDDPDRLYRNRYTVYFELDEEGRLDSVEVTAGDEIEMGADGPADPIYMDKKHYTRIVHELVGRYGEDSVYSFMLTEQYWQSYKPYDETGLLPDNSYEELLVLEDLSNYSEKKVVLDAIYADKIIRYNAYFTTDSELRLDSITVEEESVREREPESESKAE